MMYQSELLKQRGDYRGAAELYLEIFGKFPRTRQGTQAVLAAAGLYRNRLNQPARADSLIAGLKRHLTEVDSEGEI